MSYRVRIDAALAKRLLERNSENRPMRTAHITALARAILAGEWMETHQGIALDTGGRLVDGQHRLHAIIEADQSVPGITVPSLITCGISAATFAVVDTGRVRSASDILALQGEANTLRLASAVKLLFAHDNLPFGEWRRRKITNIEMNDYLHAFPDVREALRTSGNWSGQIGLIDSACAAGIFLVWREWGRESPVFERWWAGLCTGANLGQGDARLALRNHVSNRMNHTRRGPVHLALFIKAWNYCLTGRPVSMLAFRKDEDIQKVVGPVNEQETA